MLQTVEMITNENTGKEVPVFYSMGILFPTKDWKH